MSSLSSMSSKTVYLIRHAESAENVKVRHLMLGLSRLRKFKGVPTMHELGQGFSLLKLEEDAPISELGRQQLYVRAHVHARARGRSLSWLPKKQAQGV